jgi:hypothetical protein
MSLILRDNPSASKVLDYLVLQAWDSSVALAVPVVQGSTDYRKMAIYHPHQVAEQMDPTE